MPTNSRTPFSPLRSLWNKWQCSMTNKWGAWGKSFCLLFTQWVFPVVKGVWTQMLCQVSLLYPAWFCCVPIQCMVERASRHGHNVPYIVLQRIQSLPVPYVLDNTGYFRAKALVCESRRPLADWPEQGSPSSDYSACRDYSETRCAPRNPPWYFPPLTCSSKTALLTAKTYGHDNCVIYFMIFGLWAMVISSHNWTVQDSSPLSTFSLLWWYRYTTTCEIYSVYIR